MKLARTVIIITMLMHGVFVIALKNVWFHGSERHIIMFTALWFCGSVISLVRLREASKAQSITSLFDKIGSAVLYVITLIPLGVGGFFIFHSLASNGLDFW
ncbi:hypothetical protein [Vibrio sp. EA2]|uniref:hypothetical protein n=1 Tax=Vibrio sp. EA2 TaxID=3079860 RepID=UPI002949A44C|nr:hypothetical protein [Vibrio sp. EA2]MDV6250890.1 hypothetical protein [Vibrio sp. EA2]